MLRLLGAGPAKGPSNANRETTSQETLGYKSTVTSQDSHGCDDECAKDGDPEVTPPPVNKRSLCRLYMPAECSIALGGTERLTFFVGETPVP